MALARWASDLLPTNPIVLRIVANGSRRERHLWIRAGFLAVLMAALLLGMAGQSASLRDLAQRGAQAFTVLSFVQVALICVLTPLFMAGAIAQEANPRTWEILLTTPLNRVQIVAGNLAGRLFFVLALLVGALPLMIATQLFGGVPPAAVWGSFMISACTALAVAAVAVFVSISLSAGKRSVFVFYSAVVMYVLATWAADGALRQPVAAGAAASSTTVLTPLNPFLALESLLLPSSYARPMAGDAGWLRTQWLSHPVRTYCLLTTAGAVLLASAGALSVRSLGSRTVRTPWWRRTARGGRSPEPGAGPPSAGEGSDGGERRMAMRVGTNPIAWRERSLRGTSALAIAGRWGFVAAGVLAGLAVPFLHRIGVLGTEAFRSALLVLVTAETVVIVLTAINMSATSVSREREDGSLDIILTTPIQPGPYLAGKLRGLIQFLVPMLAVPTVTLAASAAYVLAGGFGAAAGVTASVAVGTGSVQVPAMLPEGAIEYPVVMLAFTAFAVMVGLQWSVRSKGTIGSAVGAVSATGVIGLVLGLCGMAGGSSIPGIGSFMNALNPVNLLLAVVTPEAIASRTLEEGLAVHRWAIAFGSALAAAVGAGAVWAMHAAIKRTFMFTVRKLAGTA
jgi:ABC-type transport system involved in multi-copper enzyme maturation permease subunit